MSGATSRARTLSGAGLPPSGHVRNPSTGSLTHTVLDQQFKLKPAPKERTKADKEQEKKEKKEKKKREKEEKKEKPGERRQSFVSKIIAKVKRSPPPVTGQGGTESG